MPPEPAEPLEEVRTEDLTPALVQAVLDRFQPNPWWKSKRFFSGLMGQGFVFALGGLVANKAPNIGEGFYIALVIASTAITMTGIAGDTWLGPVTRLVRALRGR